MKKILLIFAAIVMLCSLNSANAYTNVDFSIGFHDTLSPYGSWVHVSRYGDVWRPRVAAGWRPFTVGHWVYTNSGPYWDSEEPYGWAVYHYGHWVFDPDFGWVWVPGYEYNAAPVSWAYGDGYIGWSPIVGYNGYDANFWIFISGSRFGYRNYSPYFLSAYRVRPLFQRRAFTIVRRPLEIREVQRITRRPIRIQRITERVVTVDGRRTRIAVPRDRERTVISHIAAARDRSHHQKTVTHKTITKKEVSDVKRTYAKAKGATHSAYAKAKEKAKKTYAKAEHKIHSKNTGGSGGSGHVSAAKSKHTVKHTTKAKSKKTKTKEHGHHDHGHQL